MYDGAQLYGTLFQTKLGSTTVGSNFVLGGGGADCQGRLLSHYLPLKLYRLSLVYKLFTLPLVSTARIKDTILNNISLILLSILAQSDSMF
jgi:hypothetical protein